MATTTPNYSLRKPAISGGLSGKGDPVNAVADISDNMDILDDAIKDVDDKHGTRTYANETDGGTTIATSFSATLTGGTNPGFTFTAPPSGKVTVHAGCQIQNSGANGTLMSFSIKSGAIIGSGTEHTAANTINSIISNQTSIVRATVACPIESLTPLAVYNIQGQYRVNAGTGTFNLKTIVVEPTN